MKKLLAVLSAAAVIFTGTAGAIGNAQSTLFSTPITAAADDADYTSGDFTYTLRDNGTAVIIAYDNAKTTDLTIPSTLDGHTVTGIGQYVFAASVLETVTLPETLTSIGDYAFFMSSSLESITLPESLTSIGYAAFGYCISLNKITIPSKVTSIGDTAFTLCLYLKSITVAPTNPSYSSISGVLFNKNQTTLIAYPCMRNQISYTVPSTVTKIGTTAFTCAFYLTNLILPDRLKTMDEYAVYFCDNLTSLTIPKSVTSMGECAVGFTMDDTGELVYVDGFTLNCYQQTVAENFALIYTLSYYIIDNTSIAQMNAALSATSYTYTGTSFKPSVTLKNGATALKSGTDYTVTYKNNTIVGKATVTIKGKGRYSGTITKTFKINPKPATVSLTAGTKKATVKFTKVPGATGYEIYRATSKSGTYTKVKTTTSTSFTNTGLTKGKTYYYKVRTYKTASGAKFYSAYSPVKSVIVK
ncbi:MAG: leucine-rich repeat domain-containing protein [Oscillospiraceae bacterium]